MFALGTTVTVAVAADVNRCYSQPSFAVADFEVDAGMPEIDWMRSGLPDLIMVDLTQHGLKVLDRSLVRHVMSELPLTEQTRAGYLMGADYVVSGRVTQPEPEGIRLEAFLTEVESLETSLLLSREVSHRTDPAEIIGALKQAIVESAASRLKHSAQLPLAQSIKPEAMIAFYKGLSAYADNYPEVAFTWFFSAHDIDPRLLGAQAWKARSLEAAGLSEIAERLRSGQESAYSRETDENSLLALARPILLPAHEWTDDQILEILYAIHAGVDFRDDIMLINPEGIEHGIREHDHQLGAFFSQITMARYGQWRIPDAILQIRLDCESSSIKVRAWIEDLLTGETVAFNEESMSRRNLSTGIPPFLNRLMEIWDTECEQVIHTVAASDADPLPENIVKNLGEKQRRLAESLNELRRIEPDHETWKNMTHVFHHVVPIPALYGFAIDKAIESIDLCDPDADLALYNMSRWIRRHPRQISEASPDLLKSVDINLINKFPSSPCTGAVWYSKGHDAWRSRDFDGAFVAMRAALEILEPGRSNGEDILFLFAMYMKGYSLGRIGKTEDALSVLNEVQRKLERHPEVGKLFPTEPSMHEGIFVNQSGYPYDLRILVDSAIKTLAGIDDAASAAFARLKMHAEQELRQYSKICKSRRGFIMSALNSLIEFWETNGSINGPQQIDWRRTDMSLARSWLHTMSRIFSEEERREWFPSFLSAYAKRLNLPTHDSLHDMPLEYLFPHIPLILRLHFDVGLREEGMLLVDRFLEPAVPFELGVELLQELRINHNELQACIDTMTKRFPGAEKEVPGSLWMRLAHMYIREENWDKAARALGAAFASNNPASPNYMSRWSSHNRNNNRPTARVLINRALDMNLEYPAEAVRELSAKLGISPWMPSWWEWYNEGRSADENKEYERAIASYRVFLEYTEDPSQHDTIMKTTMSPVQSYVDSARFHMALSYILLNKHEEAALLLREISLKLGAEQTMLHKWALPRGSHHWQGRLGVIAAELLHCLHLVNEVELHTISDEDRATAVNELVAVSYKLWETISPKNREGSNHLRLRDEAEYFVSVARRIADQYLFESRRSLATESETVMADPSAVYPVAVLCASDAVPEAWESMASDMLFTQLVAKPDLIVVDREVVKRILTEQELYLGDGINPEVAMKVGNLTGANIVITYGSRGPCANFEFIVWARLIGTETGQTMGVTLRGERADSVPRLFLRLADRISEVITKRGSEMITQVATPEE